MDRVTRHTSKAVSDFVVSMVLQSHDTLIPRDDGSYYIKLSNSEATIMNDIMNPVQETIFSNIIEPSKNLLREKYNG